MSPPGGYGCGMASPVTRSPTPGIRWGDRVIPVEPPRIGDPRLHVAAVIITIHILGQVGLGFAVSIPQILAAILTAAIVEVVFSFRRTGRLIWPASAMLTGSGVALIFRLLDTTAGDLWSFRGWHLFALVAGASLVTKYLFRFDGRPVFNPSNVGLVAAFLILGSDRAEPLDFWWGPTGPALVLAYAVIIGGGLVITRRLDLAEMAGAFWVSFVAGIGVLALLGQCITARWSFEPVCDVRFFSVISTSPEVLVFLFFMITDPRTVPTGRGPRVRFAVATAVASVLLIAPQTTEFGAKVGLLAGLVVLTGLRPMVSVVKGAGQSPLPAPGHPPTVLAAAGALALAGWVVVAGSSTLVPATVTPDRAAPLAAEITVEVLPVPRPSVDPGVSRIDPAIDEAAAVTLAEILARALAIETYAMLQRDPVLLRAADFGPRLNEMEQRIRLGVESGRIQVSHYRFDHLRLVVSHPQGPQGGAARAFEATGTVETVVHDSRGEDLERRATPFALTFTLENRGTEWHIFHVVPTP